MLAKSEQHHFLPKKYNVVRFKGVKNALRNKGFKIGDNRIKIIGEAINIISHIKKIDLSDNRLTKKGA